MKLVYSFWSAPLSSRWSQYTDGNGFEDFEQSTLRCMLLSVLLARKWGFEIELVTDIEGEQKTKGFPFDKVSTELEFLNYTGKSWVQGKVMAIALQKEPFIHIDWDVFLLKPEIVKMLKNFKSDLLIQSIDGHEIFEKNYMDALTNLHWRMDYTQHHIPGLHKLHQVAFNCGIMGFNNMQLKNEFVDSFIKCWRTSDSEMDYDTSLVIEQGLLYAITEAGGYSYETILENQNAQRTAKRIGYTHLVYLSKYTKEAQDKIKSKIQVEFPQYMKLIKPKRNKVSPPLLSLCTVVMNRKSHALKTFKHNYRTIKKHFRGVVDMNILDYNSTDGLLDDLIQEPWFVEGLKGGVINYHTNNDAKIYHRTLPKNKIHELAKGQYLVNIDADNYARKNYLDFALNHILHAKNFFIRPDKYENGGGFGRILLSKDDFIKLGGYNLSISTYGFEDGEIVARLKLLNRKQILVPKHLCDNNIDHSDSDRIENKKEENPTKALKLSERKNKQITVELYPNTGIKLDCKSEQLNLKS